MAKDQQESSLRAQTEKNNLFCFDSRRVEEYYSKSIIKEFTIEGTKVSLSIISCT
jgi:hypothetical protein